MPAHTRFHRRHSRSFLIAAVALALAACAGTRVRNVRQAAADDYRSPPKTIAIVVETSPSSENGERRWSARVPARVQARHQARQLEASRTVVADLQAGLSKELVGRGLIVVPPGQSADMTLHCGLEEVRPGVGGLRAVVGLGTGKAVLRVKVALVGSEKGMHPTLLVFDTQSTTGSMPGAAIGPVPGGGVAMGAVLAAKAAGVAGGLKSGLPQETQQTVRKIDDQLRAYFSARRWPYQHS